MEKLSATRTLYFLFVKACLKMVPIFYGNSLLISSSLSPISCFKSYLYSLKSFRKIKVKEVLTNCSHDVLTAIHDNKKAFRIRLN